MGANSPSAPIHFFDALQNVSTAAEAVDVSARPRREKLQGRRLQTRSAGRCVRGEPGWASKPAGPVIASASSIRRAGDRPVQQHRHRPL